MKTKFSIIIPMYNTKKYIKDCIFSILNNEDIDYNNVQIIVVNDGSTDGCEKEVIKLQQQFDCIELYNKANGNWGSVITYVLDNVKITGDYVSILDSDDFWSKDAMKNIDDIASNHYDLIIGNFTIVKSMNGKIKHHVKHIRFFKKKNSAISPWCHPIGKFYAVDLFLKLKQITIPSNMSFLDGVVYTSLLSMSNNPIHLHKTLGSWNNENELSSTNSEWTLKKTQDFVYYLETVSKYNAAFITYIALTNFLIWPHIKKHKIKVNIYGKYSISHIKTIYKPIFIFFPLIVRILGVSKKRNSYY